jgi:hypothetical protein
MQQWILLSSAALAVGLVGFAGCATGSDSATTFTSFGTGDSTGSAAPTTSGTGGSGGAAATSGTGGSGGAAATSGTGGGGGAAATTSSSTTSSSGSSGSSGTCVVTGCPGYKKAADTVTCENGTCTFSCQGENYDVDGDETDGCEVPAVPQGDHEESSAGNAGTAPECDDGGIQFTVSGNLPSDTRVHEDPSVAGFDSTTGSAPDWFALTPIQGSLCDNDIVMQLCVTGSSFPSCYELTVITNEFTLGCQTNTSGCCPPDPNPAGSCGGTTTGSGICQNNGQEFSDTSPETPILIEVSKTCSTSMSDDAKFNVGGHL